MKKIIAYGFENDKLWVGRPTLRSWLYCFFHDGGMLQIKPIKGFENYAYYPKVLAVSFEYCHLTNEVYGMTPIAAVFLSERRRGRIIEAFVPFQQSEKVHQ